MEKKYRLLVIDDSEETVAGLKHFFSRNYEVFTAADGMEGGEGDDEDIYND